MSPGKILAIKENLTNTEIIITNGLTPKLIKNTLEGVNTGTILQF